MSEQTPPQPQVQPWWVQALSGNSAFAVMLGAVLFWDAQKETRAIEMLRDVMQQLVAIQQQQVEATKALTEALKMMTVGP